MTKPALPQLPVIDAGSQQRIQQHRLNRIQLTLAAEDCPAIVLCDPVNIRYATGTRNMQVWTMHNLVRYAVVFASGEVVLYDMPSASHLARDQVSDVRPSLSTDYLVVGDRGDEMARRWATEIAALLVEKGVGKTRLAIDRADLLLVNACQRQGIGLLDGKGLMERARAVKSLDEISSLRQSLQSCEASISDMRAQLEPGMRESEALALLIKGSIERGGEYPETRLLSSGQRTNPWFQETSGRVIENGDLIAFDTDLIGPDGFYNDISRSWVVGDKQPTTEQRRLYAIAHQQMEHNIALLQPGLSFLEYSDKAYQLPESCIPNRYADVAHGCGLGVEYPLIWYREDEEWGAYDGVFEENMVVCVECYVGEVGGQQGVKLEQPVWLHAEGATLLALYPLEMDYL